MSLNAELLALEFAKRNVGGSRCRVAVVLDVLSDEERRSLNHLIDKTDVFGTQIADVLRRNGHEIKGTHVQHHRRRVRRGGCNCPSEVT